MAPRTTPTPIEKAVPDHHPLHHLREELEEQFHDPDLVNLEPVLESPLIEAPASAREIIRKGGPRMLRDAIVPFVGFFAFYKTLGLVPGVAAATTLAVGAWAWERRNQRTGVMATTTLALILIRAVITLSANSATGDEELAAKIYLAQPLVTGTLLGLSFLGSAIARRPLAGMFASDMYSFPPEVRASDSFKRVFVRVSLAWAAFMLGRSVLRAVILTGASIEVFVTIDVLTNAPLGIGMGIWSVWYSRRGMQRSEEWGWAFRGEPPPPHLAHAAAVFAADREAARVPTTTSRPTASGEDVEAVGQGAATGEGPQQPAG